MKRLPTAFVVAGFAVAMCGCSGSGPADRVRAGVTERTAGSSLVETREGQQSEILAQYREVAENAQREADIAHIEAGLARVRADQAQSKADDEDAQREADIAHIEAGLARVRADQAQSRADESVAHYHARKIGALLGKTASQDSFTDFPYGASRYPSFYKTSESSEGAAISPGPPELSGVDRGDWWREHRFRRDKADGKVEYLTAYSDARSRPMSEELSRECTLDLPGCPDNPYVNFGWWLEMPTGIHEDADYKFATFVDGSHKYSIASLDTFAYGQAHYEGPAAGVFVKRERTTLNTHWSSFTARASLTASFNPGEGMGLEGKITDFVDSGTDTALDGWSITLHNIWGWGSGDLEREHHFPKQVGYKDDPFIGVKGVADGYELTGAWQGSFYKAPGTLPSGAYPETVAGQFRAFSHTYRQEEKPDVTPGTPTHFNDEGFVGLAGAFGAHRQASDAVH